MTVLPRFALLAVLTALVIPCAAVAQDMYDPAVLRNFALRFDDADWNQRLRDNWQSDEQTGEETLILADLDVDGTTYPDVGVRIRGNSSFFWLPPGSDKFSLKIRTDFVDPDQNVMGYDNFNLNNGFQDPTFSREVVFNNFVARFVPNPRAAHVVLSINGENWGVYNNIQQPNKRMLRDYFGNADGLRSNCSNNPNGPGLAYQGDNASDYGDYEISDDGGLADPIGAIIDVARSLSTEPLASWPNMDRLFAIDPSIWSVVLENALTDDDSYINKGCDFMLYRDPIDGRMHLFPRDNNESFKYPNWPANRNFTATNKPVLSRMLAVPELRQRYMAHYRTILRELDWAHFGPLFEAQRQLIDAAVKADTKKLYSYQMFQQNYTSSVTLTTIPFESLVGLRQFLDQRSALLAGNAELVAAGPVIAKVGASSSTPEITDEVVVTAAVAAPGSSVAKVELFYRPSAAGVYLRAAMLDDGSAGDAAANDGIYSATLPVVPTPGQRVDWYVAATAGNSFSSMSFNPESAERGPLAIDYQRGGIGMRITEWMYSGASGEFVEFTNTSDQPIDMTGWSMDDSGATPGAFSLDAFGVVQPGESVVVTESVAADFRNAWDLGDEAKVIGELGVVTGNNFGRSDRIHLYNAGGGVEDQLFYGDETFPGSIRTQNASGQAPCSALGRNDVMVWELSDVGDAYGSVAATSGDVGTPASFVGVGCDGVTDRIFASDFE